MYLFGIVSTLVLMDIIFMTTITAISGARLQREYREIEGDEVSVCLSYNCKILVIFP